jgi:hypothetical protein
MSKQFSRAGLIAKDYVPATNMQAIVVDSDTIEDRVGLILDEIESGKIDPYIHLLLGEILQNVEIRNYGAEISAIFEFVRNNVRYTRDVWNLETFQKPRRSVETGKGDCDDQAIILATLLQVAGYPVRLKLIGLGQELEHIYVLVGSPPQGATKWIPLDPSRPESMGWEVPADQVHISDIFDVGIEDD